MITSVSSVDARARTRPSGLLTFSTVTVPGIHWETGTCETVQCRRWVDGWEVRLDETIPVARVRADYIRRVTRRPHTTHTDPSGVTVFTFPPGTPCFCDHRDRRAQTVFGVGPHRRQTRQAFHIVSSGPAGPVAATLARGRGFPPEIIRAHNRPSDWREHLTEQHRRLADAINST